MQIEFSIGAIALVLFLGWITPGPNMFAVMAASLEHGRKHGLATGIGLACGAFVWATLAVSGMAILFELFPDTILILKLGGAAYLIWLGLKSIKGAFQSDVKFDLSNANERSLKKSVITGLMVSLTNPKAALFFASILTAFVPSTASSWFLMLIVIFCGVLSVILHSVTATVFSTRPAIRFFNRFKTGLSVSFGAIFFALGGSIIYSALRRSQ